MYLSDYNNLTNFLLSPAYLCKLLDKGSALTASGNKIDVVLAANDLRADRERLH